MLAGCFPAACAEPPALEVDRIGYSEAELSNLTAADRDLLATLTAFALSVSDRRMDEVAGPLVDRDYRAMLLQQAALEIGASATGLDDEALRTAYAADPDLELTVRHLVILSERWRPAAHREGAEGRARDAAARAAAGEPFPSLVAEYSEEPGAAERGGLLEPGRRGSWVPEFWAAARALEPGEVSGVVESSYGYHVLRLEGRDTVPFAEARPAFLGRVVSLPDALGATAEWLEEALDRAMVDTATVAAWLRGRAAPDGVLVTWAPDPAEPVEAPDPYRVHDLEDYLRAGPPEQSVDFGAGTVAEVAGRVRSVAGNELLVGWAAARGVEVPPGRRDSVTSEWSRRLEDWAAAFGFAPGQADRAIRERAASALTSQRQDVLRARTELPRVAAILRDLYGVSGVHLRRREAPSS